ncbi:hypothetical protein [Streptomyces sp. NPDC050560]|uniref:BACON domain-containing protein n=1 Tax=Streptomyces sp. NPDC050560 TaxID=3365630 RepID=UPI0037A0ECEE
MSSSPETPMHTTGAHRAHRDAGRRAEPRPTPRRPPASYEAHLDGLFTYCLSVLCDHDAATAALGEALAQAERRGGRAPAAESDRRAWLYALARWACVRKLGEPGPARHAAQGGRAARAERGDGAGGDPARGSAVPGPRERSGEGPARQAPSGGRPFADTPGRRTPSPDDPERQRRLAELAQLAWPEAAGTSPEQREALELAVRHRLAPHEVAAVLGMGPVATRELLASAACEIERTRAALLVVENGGCPGAARLTGEGGRLLGAALRRELVRHVDDCPRCRRTAERTTTGSWPGTTVTPATLPLLDAPRAALRRAMARAPRARGTGPRYDRKGFPVDPKDTAARRERLRTRAMATTVVATVIAAPLALWATGRGAPSTGEGKGGPSVTAQGTDGAGGRDGGRHGTSYDWQNAGNASPDGHAPGGGQSPDGVSVAVVEPGGPSHGAGGGLTVTAGAARGATVITLTARGDEPVRWSLRTGAPWLRLSAASGTLGPGDSARVLVRVDRRREPRGAWEARIAVAPSGAVVGVSGQGGRRPPGHHPGHGGHPRPHPTPSATTPTSPPDDDPTTDDPTSPPPSDTGSDDPTSQPPSSSAPPGSASGDPTAPGHSGGRHRAGRH